MKFWITVRLHKCVCVTYSSCFIMLFMNYTCRAIWASQVSCYHTTPNRYCGKFHTWCCIQKSVQQCVTRITSGLLNYALQNVWLTVLPYTTLNSMVYQRHSMHKQTYMVDSIGCSDFSDTCTVSNCRVIMNNEVRGMWKRTCMAYFEVLSHQLPVLTMGIHDEPQTGYTV
jgi:hypothetical protein